MSGRSRQLAGFTLVEVLTVIVLVSIVAALVLPSSTAGIPDQLLSTAQIIAADLAYGRSLAVLNNDKYQFQFDLKNNQYTLTYSGGTNAALVNLPPSPFQASGDPASQYVVRLANLPRLGVPLALYDVQWSTAPLPSETTTVEFGPLGATTAPQQTVIWLAAAGGAAERYLPISINAVTGLVSVGSMQATAPLTGSSSGGGSSRVGS